MSTFIYDVCNSLDYTWNEVDILVNKAISESDNVDLHNAICRSTLVLIVAHFEGFIKDVTKALLDDFNTFSSFSNAPRPMRRTFCSLFIDITQKSNDRKIESLIETFNNLDTKFKLEPFLFDNNKNPSPNIIDKYCKKFGIDNFFSLIENSAVELVFRNDKHENETLLNNLRSHLLDGIDSFPYELNTSLFNLHEPKQGKCTTMWKTFLDELLRIRHSIAHGTDLSNGLSTNDIIDFKSKIQILQYTFALVLCNFCIN